VGISVELRFFNTQEKMFEKFGYVLSPNLKQLVVCGFHNYWPWAPYNQREVDCKISSTLLPLRGNKKQEFGLWVAGATHVSR
jgi:hypothetical protein